MRNRKNHNSIVFLTTLSVYLGLVLVGTPPILAQAALTQKVEIQNEAEIKDDLDKKPDDKPCSEAQLKTSDPFIEQYAKVILAILKMGYNPKYNDYEITAKAARAPSESDFDRLFPTIKKDLTPDALNYDLDKDKFVGSFTLKSKSGNENISSFVPSFIASLNALLYESPNKPESVILKNTKITFENNQILLVTHLPRASIDELFTKKVAQ